MRSSPIVYADAGILSRLAEFGRRAFNPKHAAFHYASLFRHAIADRGDDGRISVKKLCYALRVRGGTGFGRNHYGLRASQRHPVPGGKVGKKGQESL